MQAIVETAFDAAYLITVMALGVIMMKRSAGRAQYWLFGVMAVVLGAGDAFHLVPRAWALCTTGLEHFTAALGVGKLITSITMTVFYLLLYHVWRLRYRVKGRRGLTAAMYALAALRVGLCLLPGNAWLRADAPLGYAIARNLPFAAMGVIVIALFHRSAQAHKDAAFRHMALTIVLSFLFYLPVVLWADAVPMLGMLMIPKTCAYVWTVLIGFNAMRAEAAPAA